MFICFVKNFDDKTTVVTNISVVMILACVIGLESQVTASTVPVIEFFFLFAFGIEKRERECCDEEN